MLYGNYIKKQTKHFHILHCLQRLKSKQPCELRFSEIAILYIASRNEKQVIIILEGNLAVFIKNLKTSSIPFILKILLMRNYLKERTWNYEKEIYVWIYSKNTIYNIKNRNNNWEIIIWIMVNLWLLYNY